MLKVSDFLLFKKIGKVSDFLLLKKNEMNILGLKAIFEKKMVFFTF